MLKNFCIAAFLLIIPLIAGAQPPANSGNAEGGIIHAGHHNSSIYPPEAAVIYGVQNKNENSLRSNNQIPQSGGYENQTLSDEFSASGTLLEKEASRYLLKAQKIALSLTISTLVYPFHEFL